jgi:DNA-binding NtrC family response regulator
MGEMRVNKSVIRKKPRGDFPIDYKSAREQFERQFIRRALLLHRGNVSRTAVSLNVGRRNLQVKIRQLGIDLDSIRRGVAKIEKPTHDDIQRAIIVLSQVVNV